MNINELLNVIIANKLADMQVCMPAKITAYDFKTRKASVQPSLNQKYNDGEVVELPQIHNVPVIHPAAGGASITLPVNINDPVLLVFSQKSLEEWLQNGQQVTPDDPRQNDLTDAVAHLGLQPFNVESPVESADDLMIDYDGSQIIMHPAGVVDIIAEEINMDSTTVNITAPTITLDATNVNVSGKLTAANLEATSQMKSATALIGNKDFATHTHGGVTVGAGITGAVS